MDGGTCEPTWVSRSQRGSERKGGAENFSRFLILVSLCFPRQSLCKTLSWILEFCVAISFKTS